MEDLIQNIFIPLFITVFTSITAAFIALAIGRMIDNFLDYGHIWGDYRLALAKEGAKRLNRMEYFVNRLRKLLKIEDFGKRLDAFNAFYWEFAKDDKRFMKWVCPICLITRVSLFITFFAAAVFTTMTYGDYWQMTVLFIFLTPGFTHYLASKY